MKTRQSEPVLGSRLRLERRKCRRKVPKLPEPPKTKATPRFRARCLAYTAFYYFRQGTGQTGKDLYWFAAVVNKAALAGDKLFFYYLDKYLKNKPVRDPLTEDQKKLVTLYYRNPHLTAEEAMEKLNWAGSTTLYGVRKQRALEQSRLMHQIWREG